MSRASEAAPSIDLTNRARLLVRNFVRAAGEFWEGYLKSPHGC
jgi:hypothetical protein